MKNKREFTKELTSLINRYSIENGSNTPDFILAKYLVNCLTVFEMRVNEREKWYGREVPKQIYEETFGQPDASTFDQPGQHL